MFMKIRHRVNVTAGVNSPLFYLCHRVPDALLNTPSNLLSPPLFMFTKLPLVICKRSNFDTVPELVSTCLIL